MMSKSARSLLERAKKEFWSLSPADILYFLIILFLPTQFGRHFWPPFSFISGLRVDYLSPTLYFTDILIILLFIFWFLSNLQILSKHRLKIPLSLVAILILIILGIFLSKSPQEGIYGLVKVVEFVFFGFYTMKNIRNLKLIVVALSLGLVFESFLVVAQYLNGGSLGSSFYFLGERAFNSQTPGIANASINGSLILRPYATFSHPNVLAAYMVLSMTFIIFYVRNNLKYLMITVGTIALLLTLSRIAIIIWTIVFCLNLFKKRWKFIFETCIFVGILIYLSPIGARFMNLNLVSEDFAQRVSLAKAAIDMFVRNPILGVGLNNFLPNLPSYIRQTGNIFFLQPVHNIFLLVLSETGIFGLGFFLWFLYKTFKRLIRRNFTLALILISEVLFLGLFDHYFLTLQQGQLMLALVLGICWSDTIN